MNLGLVEESQSHLDSSPPPPPPSQGRAEGLRKERDMLKLVESRLTQEKETIQSQQQSQNLLLTNLQTIQVIKDQIIFHSVDTVQ